MYRASRPIQHDSAGFTILEAMISALIVTVVILGMSLVFARGRVSFDLEEQKRAATLLAQESLEQSLGKPYATVLDGSTDVTVSGIRYTVDLVVQENVPDPFLKTVVSTVTWKPTPESERTVTLSTIIYNN